MTTPFELLVGGERYSGWQSLRITRGLERAAADFELAVSERWSLEENVWQILPGETCEIRFEDETVLTGYVDAYRPSYDAQTHGVQLSGRSKTGDFVDSSVMVDGGQFKGMTVGAIARTLAEPFGIEVVVEFEGPPEPEVQVQQGETCFALVERLSRLQELLVTDDALGRLVLTRAGAGQSTTALRHGVNILAASADLDDSRRFSEYVVKAQRPGNRTKDGGGGKGEGDDGWGEVEPVRRQLRTIPNIAQRYRAQMALLRSSAGASGATAPETLTQIVGQARDPGIIRYRPHLIVAEAQSDDASAAQRADWEMRRRLARAVRARVTIAGWRQDDGRLWQTNEMVWVDSPWLALDRELIIAEVGFTYDDGGALTELELTLPDAFLPRARRKGKRAKKDAKGGTGRRSGKGPARDPWADVAETR